MIDDANKNRRQQKNSWLKRFKQLLSKQPNNEQELIRLLNLASARDLFDTNTLKMLEGVLAIAKMQVKDIMIPRPQMISLDYDQPAEKLLAIITAASHSRFPVLGEDKDDVQGILLVKDFLKAYTEVNAKDFELKTILRPAYFVPESKRLDALLNEFKSTHNHLAMVVDEYGGIAGLVTIEDILEEIVGDIEDEFDIKAEAKIHQLAENHYHIHALTPLAEVNAALATDFIDAEVDTIGGLLMRHLGHVPVHGEELDLQTWHIKILKADARRILQVEMLKLPAPTES